MEQLLIIQIAKQKVVELNTMLCNRPATKDITYANNYACKVNEFFEFFNDNYQYLNQTEPTFVANIEERVESIKRSVQYAFPGYRYNSEYIFILGDYAPQVNSCLQNIEQSSLRIKLAQ
jgi:hypothetical protein